MPHWLLLIIVGCIVWACSKIPPLAPWGPFFVALAGILVALGVLLFTLGLLGIGVGGLA